MGIDCCRFCVPPRRTPTCKFDGTCDRYMKAKEAHDRKKAEADRKRSIDGGLTAQALRRVRRAEKARNKKG